MTKILGKNMIDSKDIVGALDKGLKVIKAFDSNNTQMTLSDVSKKVNITRASARRLLLTLESLGYMSQRDNLFSLTPKIIELGYSYFASLPWTDLAYKNMKQVVEASKLSCSISILDKEHIICIMRIPATRILNEGIHVGTRLPTAYTSTGRLFMAHMPDEELEEFVTTLPLKAHTKRSITDSNVLLEKIRSERNQPYQVVEEELEDGLLSMAAPIYNKNKEIIGAMNVGAHVSYKSDTVLKETVLNRLKKAAQETTEAIILLQY